MMYILSFQNSFHATWSWNSWKYYFVNNHSGFWSFLIMINNISSHWMCSLSKVLLSISKTAESNLWLIKQSLQLWQTLLRAIIYIWMEKISRQRNTKSKMLIKQFSHSLWVTNSGVLGSSSNTWCSCLTARR